MTQEKPKAQWEVNEERNRVAMARGAGIGDGGGAGGSQRPPLIGKLSDPDPGASPRYRIGPDTGCQCRYCSAIRDTHRATPEP